MFGWMDIRQENVRKQNSFRRQWAKKIRDRLLKNYEFKEAGIGNIIHRKGIYLYVIQDAAVYESTYKLLKDEKRTNQSYVLCRRGQKENFIIFRLNDTGIFIEENLSRTNGSQRYWQPTVLDNKMVLAKNIVIPSKRVTSEQFWQAIENQSNELWEIGENENV